MQKDDSVTSRFDALLPPEIARKAESVGAQKTRQDVLSLLVLAVLAGAFIALGAMFATTVLTGADGVVPFGPVGFGSPADIDSLTWPAFFLSLIPVTIGNIIGGGVLVGAVYWFIYLRHSSRIE